MDVAGGPNALVHHIGPDVSYLHACRELFELVLAAQHEWPDAPRWLVLTIDDSHRLPVADDDEQPGPWSSDMLVLQMHFVLDVLGPYLTSIKMPLGSYDKDDQRNDPPGSVEQLLKFVA